MNRDVHILTSRVRTGKCRSQHGRCPMKKDKEDCRKQAQALRQAGYSFGQIAKELNMPRSTVKSWCYRDTADAPEYEHTPPAKRCPQCGKEMPPSRYRPRRFCSDVCRAAYWASHGEQINRRSAVSVVCQVCHKTFQDYTKHRRKYCCHACYIAARYYGGQRNDD